MLKNYLTTVLRNLLKQPGYSFINIGGLGLGLACSFMVLLFVQHELGFDGFHRNSGSIARLNLVDRESHSVYASTASGFAVDLKAAFPEIVHAVRIENTRSPYIRVGQEKRMVTGFALADPEFFEVFTFPLVRGNPKLALQEPHSVVLTESTAGQLFGDTDPVGKTIDFGNGVDLTVTGVMEDVPSNSHLQFNYVASFKLLTEFMGPDALKDYTNYNYFTYFQLAPGVNPARLADKINKWYEKTSTDESPAMVDLEPLRDIHFRTDVQYDVNTNRDKRYVWFFSLVAAFVLIIACINFMNLTTARAIKRSKEVGVRKVIGASRSQLIRQFVGESTLLSVFSLMVALALILILLPLFSKTIGGPAHLTLAGLGTIVGLVVIGLTAGVLAGSYPAFYLSAFRPVQVLKGGAGPSSRASVLRRGLIVVQFSISVLLLMGTATVYHQLQYMKNQKLGFDKEQVLFVTMPGAVRDHFTSFKQKLLENPRVVNVSMAGQLPGRAFTNRGYNWPGKEGEEGKSFYTLLGDPDYLKTLGLTLVAGRNFSWEIKSDSEDTYILNETAVKELGFKNPVGQPFRVWDREMGTIIGVVRDFHFKSLHEKIEPVVINMKPEWSSYAVIRVEPTNITETVAFAGGVWKSMAPEYAFDYTFLDDDFNRLYQAEDLMARRFGFFAFIAIFIACLGLFGLASFSAEQRTKEIGIRKVHGATVRSIILLLSKEFTLLVGISFVLAAPAAYLLLDRWLDHFAYHITIGPGIFLFAGGCILLISWLTVSYQSTRAALVNPIESLRYE